MEARYRIVQESAGEGGFGRIDQAMDTTLERPVAIKTLDPLFRTDIGPDDVERFRREAKTLAQLSHPNIPAIYDVQFSPEAEEFRIIFEWIEGRTLRQHLQERGVLSLEEARQYFASICSALSHAHARGIVHRDIKPANIILSDATLTCYLVDFGIALRQDDVSRLTGNTPIGTSGYMSPEQERGDGVSAASDVFALGVVLYECLAGGRPAVGGYRPLGLHNEAIPPGVDTLIQAALDENPDKRPGSPRDFVDRLTATLRPHATFTSTLAEGSLHEIQLALNKMSPTDFAALPAGQRVLVTTRLADLATVDDEPLRRAVAALITELVRLAHPGDETQFQRLVTYAIDYGFKKQVGENWWGDGPTRSALNSASLVCGEPAHEVISSAVISLTEEQDVETRPGWYFHDMRGLLQNLLTNPVCGEDRATALGAALARINALSH